MGSEDFVTRAEHEALVKRVTALETSGAVSDNEIKHIRDDIAWIKKGVMFIVGIMATAVIGAILNLVIK